MTYLTKRPHGNKYYVTPHKDGWAVRGSNSRITAYSYPSKDKALSTAIFLAKENHAELVIQKSDGSIQEKLSFQE